MSDRIHSLVKRIHETRPVQSGRRQTLLEELRAVRRDLGANTSPEQVHALEAAVLLMEFMSRSEDVATAETLGIVASLVGTVDERSLRTGTGQQPVKEPPPPDVAEHRDLRMTQEFLLGSILVHAGVVSPESLARALQLHASSGLAVGHCLVQLGAASPEQIASAVSYQDRLREEERATRAQADRQAKGGLVVLRLSAKQQGYVKSMHSQVLGEILIRLGAITREQLERALQVQRAASVHVGEALVETGAATWEQIKRGLEVQKQLRRSAA